MAGLINAGLPLLRTLTILSEQTTDKRLQGAIISVHAEVESGVAFSAALASHPDVFPPLMVNVIRVGETGGFLGAAMESVARTYTNESELRNRVRAAVTYPIIVLVIAILGVIAMVTFVVPVFAGMFAGLGSQLPLPTQVLVGVSSNMWWILPLLLVCGGAVWLVWRRQRRSEAYRRVVDPMKLKLPVFGSMITKIAAARFARNLAMMLDAGVPLVQGLDVIGKASDNWAIEQAVRSIQASIRDGKSFSAPLAKAAVFPPMVAQMVSVGEESGTLSAMLASVADFYEKEVETATSQLTSVIEPILIVGIGLIIGGMVVTLYLPIFTIYGELSRQ
nr:type II secretion system F family protein [Microbacterium yannicii]